jgi:hypothetical protein
MRNFLAFWLVCGQRFRLPPTYFWFHVLLFSMGAMMVAPAESYYAIFATARLGESTRDALVGDFELSLIEDAILTGFGVLLFSGAVVFFARKGFGPTRLGFWLSLIMGGLYVTMPFMLAWLRIDEMSKVLFWSWILLFPLLSARVTVQNVDVPIAVSRPMSH